MPRNYFNLGPARHGLWVLALWLCAGLSWAQGVPSMQELLAQTPEQQDQTLTALYEARDYANVMKLATALGNQGSLVGASYMGFLYLTGQGVAKDSEKGVKLIKFAAESGNLRAQAMSGAAFAVGKMDLVRDRAQGMQYLLATVEKFDEAAEMLAMLYEEGLQGVARDKAKALAVYKNRRWTDPGRWQDKIRQLEGELFVKPTVSAFLDQNPQQQDQTLAALQAGRDHAGVFELASALAARGSMVGQHYLGQAYLGGNGVAQDVGKGRALLFQAADAGFKRAQMMAGVGMLFSKDESLRNDAVALKYVQASASEFAESAMALGQAYEQGKYGLAVDKARALALYKSVTDVKYAAAIKGDIEKLEAELKIPPTPQELAALDAVQQELVLAELYDKKKDYATVMLLATFLADKDSPVGQQYLGLIHWEGKGVKEDEPRGAALLAKSAAAGLHRSEWLAGRGMLFEKWGFARNEVLAVKYLQACFAFYYDCAYELARAYENGWGGLSVDKPKALDIFKTYKWSANYKMMGEIKKKIKQLDPTAGSQDLFMQVMQAAKNIGVRVNNAKTEGNSFFGDGTLTVNGSIKVGFSAELMILEGQLPKLFLQLSSSDRRVHDPLRKRYLDALQSEVGNSNLRQVFNHNSTMFTSW